MITTAEPSRLTITMISAPAGCKKCAACLEIIKRIQERHPGQVELKVVTTDSPEAAEFGVVMPPMVILDDFIVCAGNVPMESGFEKLVAQQLGKESAQ